MPTPAIRLFLKLMLAANVKKGITMVRQKALMELSKADMAVASNAIL